MLRTPPPSTDTMENKESVNNTQITSLKRGLESPDSDGNSNKTPRNSKTTELQLTETCETRLLAAIRKMIIDEQTTKIQSIIGQEMDKRMVNVALKSDVESLEGDIKKLNEENLSLKNIIIANQQQIESQNQLIGMHSRTLNSIDNDRRRNNLIFKNVSKGADTKTSVESLCFETLQLKVEDIKIKKVIKLSERNGRWTLLVNFDDNKSVGAVLGNVKNLKGSNIYVERDLGEERRQNQKILLKLKKEVSEAVLNRNPNERIKMIITGDVLRIGTSKFVIKDGKIFNGDMEGDKYFLENFNFNVNDFLKTCN